MAEPITEKDLLEQLQMDAAGIRSSHSSIQYSELVIHNAVKGLGNQTTMTNDGRKQIEQISPNEHPLHGKNLDQLLGDFSKEFFSYDAE